MHRLGVIIFLFSLFWVGYLNAQLSIASPSPTLLQNDQSSYFEVAENSTNHLPSLRSLMLQDSQSMQDKNPGTSLLYQPHLAFFCRLEVKIDQAIGTPFRFRLGSVDYVDYLEGKRSDY
ncbi:MAG: hypothetical protein AAFU67_01840 [Bacteroidota bacterium]